MSSKGAITITQEELIRMKMKANVISNRMIVSMQSMLKITFRPINIKKAKNEPITGAIILNTSKKEKRKRGSKSSKRKSWNADESMKSKRSSNSKKKRKNWPLPTKNSSKIPRKWEVSTVNFSSLILFRAENNKNRSKAISKISKRKENNSITNKPWYFINYLESNSEGRRVGKKNQGRIKK